jgi:hypothetical protein
MTPAKNISQYIGAAIDGSNTHEFNVRSQWRDFEYAKAIPPQKTAIPKLVNCQCCGSLNIALPLLILYGEVGIQPKDSATINTPIAKKITEAHLGVSTCLDIKN